MERYIQDFTIHAYKGIHNLKLDNLNIINILTGDNNSGKTSALELLSTLESPENTRSWALGSRVNSGANTLYFNCYYNMFPIDEEKKEISYSFTDHSNRSNTVSLKAEFVETQISGIEMYRLKGFIRTGSTKREEEIVDTTCMRLFTDINGEKVNEDQIYDFQQILPGKRNKKDGGIRTFYISPVDYASSRLNLNDILSDTELYKEMINILQMFDENIVSINALKDDKNPFVTEYMVLTKNHAKALPLTSYGDGMKKAMLLLSSVVRARNGILLLDEFETAIHTSAMDSVFSWLLQSAVRLNVQVFLTSHSKEAIDKVLHCSSDLQPYINLYTLYNYDGKNYVRRMSCEEAINAKDNLGLELR